MNEQMNHTDLVPLKMCSSTVILDQYLPGWQLALPEDCATPEPRSFQHYIEFDNPFSTIPVVQAGLTGFDIDKTDTTRLRMHVADISNNGFSIVIETWMHTRVYMVEVSWIALGSA